MWISKGFSGGNAFFRSPESRDYANGVYNKDSGLVKFRNCCWFTNIDHGHRHVPLKLMTKADNIKYSRHKEIKSVGYKRYDNYDAIEVPFTDAIPCDYDGTMGVPVTFLDKYCPEQFEIVALGNLNGFKPNKLYVNPISHIKGKNRKNEMINSVLTLKGKDKKGNYYTADNIDYTIFAPYARILIKRKVK